MLLLAHAGLTLGAAVLLNQAFNKVNPPPAIEALEPSAETGEAGKYPSWGVGKWFSALTKRIDIRLLFIGSLLPDIIDKPVGQLLFGETFSNGRVFCHTLLFLILVSLAGFYLYRSYSKNWLLVISFGTFTHLVLDQMWRAPQTLLWPLYGFAFGKIELTGWAQYVLHSLYADPAVYIPESIGAVILVLFLWILVINRSLVGFIVRGRL